MLRSILAIAFMELAFGQAPRYTLHDLGPLNQGTITGINSRGQVIGYYTLPDQRVRSFRTAPNAALDWTTDDLGTLGGTITRARGINATGQVAGDSTLSTGETRGFRTAPNKPIQPSTDNIGTLANTDTQALAINDLGQVTGVSGSHAFLTAPNSPIDAGDQLLLKPADLSSIGRRVNNQGHVLGSAMGRSLSYPTAFLHTGRTNNILDFLSAPFVGFTGLTEQDQIVFNPTSGPGLMLWENGREIPLASCAMPCVPSDLNNSLQVVGATRLNPFLYTDGAIYDLNALIPAGSGWTLSTPGGAFFGWAINDLGQIAGSGMINNETHAIRLDPVNSVQNAIHQAMNEVQALHLDRRARNTSPLLLKASLETKLEAALNSWNSGNPGATRGFLNEFENIVRAHSGELLSQEDADGLLQLAEAAIALT